MFAKKDVDVKIELYRDRTSVWIVNFSYPFFCLTPPLPTFSMYLSIKLLIDHLVSHGDIHINTSAAREKGLTLPTISYKCVFGGSILGGFARIWLLFVYVRVSSGWILSSYVILHRRRLLFWCAGPMGLNTTTSRLSTTISFARLRGWRGDDDGAPSARISACSRR